MIFERRRVEEQQSARHNFGLALSSLGFLAMRFPCSEMKVSEIGPACVLVDDHVSDVDARIGQWFAVAGGAIALWGSAACC